MENEMKRMLVIGITYNKVERGVYALVLQELGGTRRLPIVIGMAEAQSIECKLQEIITPRPLTHDLMVNIMRAFGITLNHVLIKQLDGGIFAADLHLTDGEREVVIDARSSDGISIALRMGVPIYASEQLLSKTAFEKTSNDVDAKETKENPKHKGAAVADCIDFWEKVMKMQVDELEDVLNDLVANEEYEKAAKLRDLINKKRKQDKDE